MQNYGLLDDYRNAVTRFVDTIKVFKNCPLLRGNRSFSQYNLVERLLGEEMFAGAHNAKTDVKNLRALLRKLNISWQEVIQEAYN